MLQYMRLFGITLLFSAGVGSVAKAASFDCNKARTQTEIAICDDPALSALDELASVFSPFVGLRIDVSNIPEQPEYVSDDSMTERLAARYSDGIRNLMSLVDLSDVSGLSNAINILSGWDAALFSDDNVMLIRSKKRLSNLNDGIIVFSEGGYNPDRKPVFFDLDTHINAISSHYSFVDEIIIREGKNKHHNEQLKYRNQDGCWRLIGSEWEEFFDSGPADEVRKQSINMLIGQMLETLYNDKERMTRFVPSITCLSENP